MEIHQEIEISRVLSEENNPGFVKIFEVIEDNQSIKIVMELVEGQNFHKWILGLSV